MSKNFVVFDLEMNQGYKPFTFSYHGVEQTFRGEIIQIGAAKVDENFRVKDTFTITMKPQIFRKLHHHVAKVTGLTQQMLNTGVSVKQGMQRFLDWCGDDAIFLEWGLDDVPVLKQNLVLLGMDENFPAEWYDVQQMVSAQFPPAEGEKMNLEAVVERLKIPMDRPFHDALSDVLYTCEVAQKLDAQRAFAEYPTEEEQLYAGLARKGEIHGFTTWYGYYDNMAWRNDPEICRGNCPICGAELKADEYWGKLGSNGYYSLALCDACKKQAFILFKLSKKDGLHWNFARATRLPDEESLAKWEKEKKGAMARRAKKEKENAQS